GRRGPRGFNVPGPLGPIKNRQRQTPEREGTISGEPASAAGRIGIGWLCFRNNGDRIMADWKKLALSAILVSGKVEEAECKLLKKEVWADGKSDEEEMEFLLEVRAAAAKKAKARKEELAAAFDTLFFKAVRERVVQEGKVSGEAVEWLRTHLFGGKKVDA